MLFLNASIMVATKKLVKEKIDAGYLQGVPWCKNWGGRAEMMKWLKEQPLLKAVLAGHIHVTVADRFSSTAVEYVAGGNFLFHGQEITIS